MVMLSCLACDRCVHKWFFTRYLAGVIEGGALFLASEGFGRHGQIASLCCIRSCIGTCIGRSQLRHGLQAYYRVLQMIAVKAAHQVGPPMLLGSFTQCCLKVTLSGHLYEALCTKVSYAYELGAASYGLNTMSLWAMNGDGTLAEETR